MGVSASFCVTRTRTYASNRRSLALKDMHTLCFFDTKLLVVMFHFISILVDELG